MKNRKFLSAIGALAMVACMAISMMPVPFLGTETDVEVETEIVAEEDIPEDAIYISTSQDLEELVENCRVNTWSVDKTVVLANDIEIDSTGFEGIPTFGGTFLGQGHSVSGLYLTGEGSVVGFFRYLQETAVVRDLVVSGTVEPEGTKCVVGGIAGNNAGTIQNCAFNGTVSGTQQIGGLVGINETSGLVQNCIVTGNVYGNHFIGGLVGENHGVVRKSSNAAEVNTSSVQNSIALEDISLDSLTSSESAASTTDIGGIVGTNSGVIRECTNNGLVGYKNMGYNIGGIAGNQNGYVVNCVNNAEVFGRKEVGGIVGHMEPNIVLNFSVDGLQQLSDELSDLEASLGNIKGVVENNGDEMEADFDRLDTELSNAQNAVDALLEALGIEKADKDDVEDLEEDLESDIEDIFNDLVDIEDSEDLEDFINSEMENLENSINTEDLEDFEEYNPDEIDKDKAVAAINDFGDSIDGLQEAIDDVSDLVSETSEAISGDLDKVLDDLQDVTSTVESLDDTINMDVFDSSDDDTEVDTLGKVAGCLNNGIITGEYNVGGIAGIIAEETEFDAYEDVETNGDVSLNFNYETRAVIRGCKNYGTIVGSKQAIGGVVGKMQMGVVLESLNFGNLDALNADYVGGIAGDSYTIIRRSGTKCVIAGDKCVGGIAGAGNEVTDCYAFVEMKAYTEKAGTVVGEAAEIPDGEEDVIFSNYYFVPGVDVGGIDGVTYTGATDRLSLKEFLQLEGLDETFGSVTVRFVVDGQDDVVFHISAGESLSLDDLPKLEVAEGEEYQWEIQEDVTYESLGMGETAKVELLSKESITNILFNQTYEASFDTKNTVIRSKEATENYLAIILAEGVFASNTTLITEDVLVDEAEVNGKDAYANWMVSLSNSGVKKLHFYIPTELNAEYVQVLVKDAEGNWTERESIVDGSYVVFEYTDGDVGFALVQDTGAVVLQIVKIAAVVVAVLVVLGIVVKKRKAKKEKK